MLPAFLLFAGTASGQGITTPVTPDPSFPSASAASVQRAVPRGPFMIAPAGDDRNAVWRVDQSTGRVSYCVRNINSVDPQLIASRAPFCSAWSND